MKKIPLGLLMGAVCGLLDGLSAFLIPDAASMMTQIIIGSTVKGLINGLVAGVVAKRTMSVTTVTLLSGVTGIVLSVLSAIPSGAYVEIIVPGIFVGILSGFVTARWGK
jgi:hypothetical protein